MRAEDPAVRVYLAALKCDLVTRPNQQVRRCSGAAQTCSVQLTCLSLLRRKCDFCDAPQPAGLGSQAVCVDGRGWWL